MPLRELGQSGAQVSRIGLGTMTFGAESDEGASRVILDEFVDAGGTLVDTADVYSDGVSEEWIGRWLRDRPGVRERIFLATKGRFPITDQPGASLRPEYLRRALDASLRRLGVDHVDLYQAHAPDEHTSMEELADFFAEAVESGKTRYVGVSNLPGWQTAKLAEILRSRGGPPLASHQPQYNLLSREAEWEVVPAALDAGVGLIVWAPLASGWLTGKYRRDAAPAAGTRLGEDPSRGVEAWDKRATDRTWAVLDRLHAAAQKYGRPPAQIAVAWVADRPAVSSAIVGARTVEQLRDVLPAAELSLDAATAEALDEVSAPQTPDYPYGFIELNVARGS
jgi:aryl-alcohol dehydrogenase-like predicted oxidoreductase